MALAPKREGSRDPNDAFEPASALYMDHVKVLLVGEDSVHFIVHVAEGVSDAVGNQVRIAYGLVEEVVGCKTGKSFR